MLLFGYFLDKIVEIDWDLKICQILGLVRVSCFYNFLFIICIILVKMLFLFFLVFLLDCDWNRSIFCNYFLYWFKGIEKVCKKIYCDIYGFYGEL